MILVNIYFSIGLIIYICCRVFWHQYIMEEINEADSLSDTAKFFVEMLFYVLVFIIWPYIAITTIISLIRTK